MEIKIIICPHLYAEEKLVDVFFNNTEVCGIMSPEEFGALWNHRDYEAKFSFSEKTTIGEVVKFIVNILIEDIYDDDDQFYFSMFLHRVYFWGRGERFYPSNHSANFEYLLNKYLDPDKTGVVYVDVLTSMDAGRVWTENSLRYDMHSREGNHHNEPHVHVRDIQSDLEASISLYDQRVLSGGLPGRLLKTAKRTVKDHQGYFIQCWNEKTDGLVADIDRHFGLIQY